MERRGRKISYVKKPMAKKGIACLALAAVALVCGLVSLQLSVAMQGNGGLNVGAWGFSSFLFAVTALVYGGLSFLELEKNYILSKIGIGLGILLLIFWICMLIVGLAG